MCTLAKPRHNWKVDLAILLFTVVVVQWSNSNSNIQPNSKFGSPTVQERIGQDSNLRIFPQLQVSKRDNDIVSAARKVVASAVEQMRVPNKAQVQNSSRNIHTLKPGTSTKHRGDVAAPMVVNYTIAAAAALVAEVDAQAQAANETLVTSKGEITCSIVCVRRYLDSMLIFIGSRAINLLVSDNSASFGYTTDFGTQFQNFMTAKTNTLLQNARASMDNLVTSMNTDTGILDNPIITDPIQRNILDSFIQKVNYLKMPYNVEICSGTTHVCAQPAFRWSWVTDDLGSTRWCCGGCCIIMKRDGNRVKRQEASSCLLETSAPTNPPSASGGSGGGGGG